MSGTIHVTLRLPVSLVEEIDLQAKAEMRSRSQVILRRLYGVEGVDADDSRGEVERSGDGAAVPILPKAKGKAKRLHKVQPVRDKLARRRGFDQKPVVEQGAVPRVEAHEGHRVLPYAHKKWCSDCRVFYEG